MKKTRIFAIIALAVLAAACEKEVGPKPEENNQPEDSGKIVFTAQAPSRTATADDEHVTWVAGDEVKFVWAGGSVTAEASTSGTSTTFSVEVGEEITELYAVYPASVAGSYDEGNVNVHFNGSRTDGSFAANDICVAKAVKTGDTWNTTLAFKNVACLLKVGVTTNDIVKLQVKGLNDEVVSGLLPVNIDGGIVSYGAVATPGTSMNMTVSGPGNYYIPVLPGVTFSNGFRVNLFTDAETQSTPFYYNGSFTTARGQIIQMADIEGKAGHYYVTPSGAGTKAGQSWTNAMGVDEFKTLVTNADNYFILQGATIHFSADEFSFGDDYLCPDFSGHGTVNLTFEGTIDGANRTTFLGRTNTSESNKAGVLWPKTSTNLTVRNVKFTGTNGTSNSAAIRVNSTGVVINLDNCIFQGNQTASQSAAINMIKGTANVTNCEFTGNVAGKGASLHIENATANVSHCTFTNNTGDGGFLHCSNTAAVVNVEDCDVSGGNRCAIYNENANTVTLTRVKIHDVHAVSDSGPAGWLEGAGTFTFTDCEFIDNCADSRAGAICIYSGDIHATFTGGKFQGNHSDGAANNAAGGALYLNGTDVSVDCTNVLFKENYNYIGSNTQAGGIIKFNTAGVARFNGCVFDGNYTNREVSDNASCAAIVNHRAGGAKYYFNACEFKENTSGTGNSAGVYGGTNGTVFAAWASGVIAMNNCSMHDNYGGRNTDAIHWIHIGNAGCKFIVSNSTIVGDRVRPGGTLKNKNGVIRLDNSPTAYFINSIVCSNYSDGKSVGCAATYDVTSYYSKTSAGLDSDTNWSPDTGSGHDYYASSSCFGSWSAPYTWNGTLTGTNSNMKAATADVNTEIQNADSDFYDWLNSIGALGKDINGNSRGATSWPGCYQN